MNLGCIFSGGYAAAIINQSTSNMMNKTMAKQIENCNKFLDNHRWLSVWDLNYKNVRYSRNPTKGGIAFGYGATHYRSFPLKEVVGCNGQIKKRLYAKDEQLWYSLA